MPAGLVVWLALSADQKTVESIVAEEPVVRGMVKKVDAAKKTLTVAQQPGRDREAEETTFTVAANTEIAVDDGRGKRLSIKEGTLADVSEGAVVTMRLSLDRKQVTGLLTEGLTINGAVKSIDPAKKTLTVLVRPPRGDDMGEERNLVVSTDAVILLDDGKGRRLSVKEVKLADIPTGAMVMVKMSPTQPVVMMLRAEGPTVTGMLKASDPEKGTITITIPKGRDEAEEKTFPVAKDARITIEGSESKFADLKVGENGPVVQLRLSLDQKAVQSIAAWQPRPR
jgi:hypothetical protein